MQAMGGAGRGSHKAGYGTASTDDRPTAVPGGRGAHTGRPEPVAPAPVAAAPEALVVSGGWQIEGRPATVRRAGPQAAARTVEFFTAQIRNPHTRAAYAAAVTRFFTWCDARGLALAQISPIAVATYIEEMQRGYRAPTIKQHLAAIRRLFDWLVTGPGDAHQPGHLGALADPRRQDGQDAGAAAHRSVDVFRMIKRRVKTVGLGEANCTPSGPQVLRRICSMAARSSAPRRSPRIRARARPSSRKPGFEGAYGRARSVREKSSPLQSSGSPSWRASAYAKQSP